MLAILELFMDCYKKIYTCKLATSYMIYLSPNLPEVLAMTLHNCRVLLWRH
jgi:hypothetical protein